jgi:hypothetical protein
MSNTIFFNDSKAFFNQVMQRNILNKGYGNMITFCGKYLSQKTVGKLKKLYTKTINVFKRKIKKTK